MYNIANHNLTIIEGSIRGFKSHGIDSIAVCWRQFAIENTLFLR